MAALDFPANPTDGQVYGNWIYNTAKGAWKAKPLTPGQAQVSSTAPSTPSNGDQWYNTNDGNLYVYYNDGDTSQWVQIKSDATLSSTLGPRVDALELAPAGLVRVVPTSVAVSGGSATVSATGKVTFTSVTSVALNGIFSSTFENYRIVYIPTGIFTTTHNYRFRAGSTDDSAASYYFQESYMTGSTGGGQATTGQTVGRIGYSEANVRSPHIFDIVTPFLAQRTDLVGMAGRATGNVTVIASGHTGNTSFDGINLFLGSSTLGLSGTVQVYGYRN